MSRVEKVRTVPPERLGVRPPAPRSAKIELTSRCDLHCAFCASHIRPRAGSDMSWTFYRRIVRELRAAGVEQLGLFYIGESFLCEWLPEAIRYAREACGYPYVFLTTNGLRATPDRVRACMSAGLNSLKFSINWGDADEFERGAGVAARHYPAVLENLRTARTIRDALQRETGMRCAIYASSLCRDKRESSRMQARVAQIEASADAHYWLPLFGHRGGDPDGGHVAVKPLPCGPLFTEAHVTWNGRLSACSLDASPRFEMADLDTMPFAAAWHSIPFQRLRAAHLAGDAAGTVCSRCIGYGPRAVPTH